ncbi:hypothetical protein [Oceanivirga miroungae]|uniref:Uncharacterized protein n=1 Tax=Oceanivirga miroungae TaxID=1130046 RepID=A0A6I8MDD8_9FUSO|nr:hypothetical protein [Oceanivirga miroungae]VWL85525.1 hypothetical protein OMES3154_00811 [Oceanivirga miroungae]
MDEKLIKQIEKEYKDNENAYCGCEMISFDDYLKFRLAELSYLQKK